MLPRFTQPSAFNISMEIESVPSASLTVLTVFSIKCWFGLWYLYSSIKTEISLIANSIAHINKVILYQAYSVLTRP